MALSQVGSGGYVQGVPATAGQTPVPKDGGTSAGDLAVLLLSWYPKLNTANPSPSPPAGWTNHGTVRITNDGSILGAYAAVFSRSIDGGEGGDFSVGLAAEAYINIILVTLRGSGALSIESVTSGTPSVSGTSATAPSVTATSTQGVVCGWAISDPATMSVPSGMTGGPQGGSGTNTGRFAFQTPGAGATGEKVSALSVARSSVGFTILVNGAAAAGGSTHQLESSAAAQSAAAGDVRLTKPIAASAISQSAAAGGVGLGVQVAADAVAAAAGAGSASVVNGRVSLSWTPSADPLVTRYYIGVDAVSHDGQTSTAYPVVIDAGNATNYVVTGLTPGTLYYFGVSSAGAGGHDEFESHVIEISATAVGTIFSAAAGVSVAAAGSLSRQMAVSASAVSVASASGSFSVAMPLQAVTAAAAGSASGSLSIALSISAAAVASAVAAGVNSLQAMLIGPGTAAVSASGDLTQTGVASLSASALASALAAGNLSQVKAVYGDAVASALAGGALSMQVGLAGPALASVQAGGSMGGGALVPMAADAFAGSSAAGAVSLAIPVTAAVLAAAAAGGQITVTVPMQAGAMADVLAGGQLQMVARLAGSAAGAAGAAGSLWVSLSMQADALAASSATGTMFDSLARPNDSRRFVVPPRGAPMRRRVIEKRPYESAIYDVPCSPLLAQDETIVGLPIVVSTKGSLSFGPPSVNAEPITYRDGAIEPAGTVIQVRVSGGAIPAGSDTFEIGAPSLACPVRVRFATNFSNSIEADVVVALTDIDA